jgi:hypothetical protein
MTTERNILHSDDYGKIRANVPRRGVPGCPRKISKDQEIEEMGRPTSIDKVAQTIS